MTDDLFLDELSIRSKAINLVDSVLEQSLDYINSQPLRYDDDNDTHQSAHFDHFRPTRRQHSDEPLITTFEEPTAASFPVVTFEEDNNLHEYENYEEDRFNDPFFDQPPSALNVHVDHFVHSDSENFAITSDLSNGLEFIKSPTIESISGKSFDENISPQGEEEVDKALHIIETESALNLSTDKYDSAIGGSSAGDGDEIIRADGAATKTNRRAEKIDRKFEQLTSQLADSKNEEAQTMFESTALVDLDEVSQLQHEFSKMSWDESQSPTTVDQNLSTPENDFHDQGDN